MKKLSQAMVCAAAVVTTVASSVALAESPLTSNVGFTSNYIWRGQTQTSDNSAMSGGIDYAHDSGAYAGIWVSSLDGNSQYEQDLYVGFGGEAGPLSYDVSYIQYMYPVGDAVEADFAEIMISLGYGPATLTIAPTISKEDSTAQEDDMYMSLSAEFEVKKGLTLGVLYGMYDFDEAAGSTTTADYSHYQISLSKGDFVFAYDVKDPDTADSTGVEDAPRVSVSWSKSFDL